jgi:thioredoxin 1
MIAPVIDSLAGELEGKAIFAKLNVDENPKTSERFRVMSIPTLIIFSGGSESDRIIGFTSREAILARLNPYI